MRRSALLTAASVLFVLGSWPTSTEATGNRPAVPAGPSWMDGPSGHCMEIADSAVSGIWLADAGRAAGGLSSEDRSGDRAEDGADGRGEPGLSGAGRSDESRSGSGGSDGGWSSLNQAAQELGQALQEGRAVGLDIREEMEARSSEEVDAPDAAGTTLGAVDAAGPQAEDGASDRGDRSRPSPAHRRSDDGEAWDEPLLHSGLDHDDVLMLLGNDTDAVHAGPHSLPAGFEIRVGDTLPPDAPIVEVPIRVLTRLPYLAGYSWLRAGNDLLLVHYDRRVVSEVIGGVFD